MSINTPSKDSVVTFYRFAAILRCRNDDSHIAQQLARELPIDLVIFNQQHTETSKIHKPFTVGNTWLGVSFWSATNEGAHDSIEKRRIADRLYENTDQARLLGLIAHQLTAIGGDENLAGRCCSDVASRIIRAAVSPSNSGISQSIRTS